MKTLNRTLLIVALSWTAAGCRSSEWTGLGGDLGNNYNNRDETKLTTGNAARLAPIWETKRYGTVNGAVAVVGDVVYVVSRNGTYAVRASNGEQIWANRDCAGTSSPTYNDGQLFVHDAVSVLHVLDAGDGHEFWQAKTDQHPKASGFSSPVVSGSFVIVGTSSTDEVVNTTETSSVRGSVVAFNRSTGKEVWRHYTVDPPFNGATVWSTVAIDTQLGLVYGATGNNYTGEASNTSDSLFALRLLDGSVAWWTQLSKDDVFTVAHANSPDSDFGTSPILFEAKINGVTRKLLGAGQKSGAFWALDRLTGAIAWSRMIVPEGSAIIGGMLNNGAFDGEHILVSGARGTSTGPGSEPSNGDSPAVVQPTTAVLEALNPSDGTVVWERQLPAWTWAPITVANGVGFVTYETAVQAFDVKTGVKLFDYKTAGTISSAPVVANGALFFGSGIAYIGTKPDETLHALAVDGKRVGGDPPEPDAGPDAGDAGPGDAGPLEPTYTNVLNNVLKAGGCDSAFCHGAGAGNFLVGSPAQTYDNLVNFTSTGPLCGPTGGKRVVPGDPEASILLDKISHATPSCGSVMPPGTDVTLSADKIELVRAWIAAGAPEN